MEKIFTLSKYSIITKLEADDNYMLVHGYTGAVDIVSKEVGKSLNTMKIFSKKNVPFSENTFDILVSRGYLTNKTQEQEQEYVTRMGNVMYKLNKVNDVYMFLVAYDCNFRCPYCFEETIAKKGNQWSRKVFTKDMVDKAYNAMNQIWSGRKQPTSSIILYGGEPLLASNKDIVSYIVNKGVDLGYKFDAITNGYDLDHFEDMLGPNRIEKLQITIDGTKDRHNLTRIHYKENNTYDKIIKNIEIALKNDTVVTIRVNTNRDNVDELTKLMKIFQEYHYTDNPKFSMYAANLVDYNFGTECTKNENCNLSSHFMSKAEFVRRQKSLDFKFGLQDRTLDNILNAIKNKQKLKLSPIFCTAQSSMYIFDPFGEIYACWNTVGDKNEVIGNYQNKLELKNDNDIKWRGKSIVDNPVCVKCKYLFICQGQCRYYSSQIESKFNKVYCTNYQEIFKIITNEIYNKYCNI